ncbi:Uncharacterised protein [Vibrio cholerae]|nr:Uncharacterised protein [Vibrio cholerae]
MLILLFDGRFNLHAFRRKSKARDTADFQIAIQKGRASID